MPIDRLIVILACVIAAAGATIWLVTALLSGAGMHPVTGGVVLMLIAMVLSVILRRYRR